MYGEQSIGGGVTGENFLQQTINRQTQKEQNRLQKDFEQQIKKIETEILESGRIQQAVEDLGTDSRRLR